MTRLAHAIGAIRLPTLATLAILVACSTGCAAKIGAPSGITDPSGSTSRQGAKNGALQPSYRIIPHHLEERGTSNQDLDPPLKLLGRGTSARIVDLEGNILRSGAVDGSIYGLQMSPNNGFALINNGDAKFTVAPVDDLDTGQTLPSAPPEPRDATGFGWRWLNDQHLLGSADLPSADTEGKTAAEIEGTPPRATLLYVYRLETGALTPVHIDPTLPDTFMVHDTSGWNVTLLSHDDQFVGAKVEQVPEP
ncbi:hypothetical protein ACOPJQ_05255 [Luteimonas dalianensis]|uniref:hypothetical protein n=1 Tax=Luteimonas dalianensis TaxID=1148196 RepID=UPI003BF456CA